MLSEEVTSINQGAQRHKTLLFILFFFLFSASALAKERMTFLYYYGWYGNPAYDAGWSHWQENDHEPPWDISSSFYPKLGAYSSRDPSVIELHMSWISQTNVDALIFSWWGREDSTHDVAAQVLDWAARFDLKISFLIEPYPGRTTKTICDDIELLTRDFGMHPAFLRIARPTAASPNPEPRGLFFIYDPNYSDEELQLLSDTIHHSEYDSILLYQSTDATLIERARADGIFAYEAVINISHFYKGIQESVEEKGGLFVPCVSPGFDVRRHFKGSSAHLKRRKNGKTYDESWEHAIVADPEFIAVLSFNEWHEGTQIEPAIRVTKEKPGYLSYEDAYGNNGDRAQFGYLRRTARWIKLFLQLP